MRSAPLVRLLTERYQPSLAADPGLLGLLKKAAAIYVILKPGGSGAPLGGLLGNLMAGGDMHALLMSDEDEEVEDI